MILGKAVTDGGGAGEARRKPDVVQSFTQSTAK